MSRGKVHNFNHCALGYRGFTVKRIPEGEVEGLRRREEMLDLWMWVQLGYIVWVVRQRGKK